MDKDMSILERQRLMLFKKKIETTSYINTPWIIIKAVHKNRMLGKITCILNEEIKTITISDIQCKKNNRSYGSLMMKKLIEYAKQNDIKSIEGWISEVDYDHIERLYHFYQKFDFEIVPNNDVMKFADIKLYL